MQNEIKTRYELSKEDFDKFEAELESMAVSGNEKLMSLLTRPKRWDESGVVKETEKSVEKGVDEGYAYK